MNDMIAIVAILCVIGLPVSIPIVFLALSYRKRVRLMELHHAERMASIERGMDPPPFPREALGPWPGSRSGLLPGVIWLFVGLALIAALRGFTDHDYGYDGTWVWALVPIAVGAGYLVYYFVEGRKALEQDRAREGVPLPKENP